MGSLKGQGNHNFCRNGPGDDFAPFCFTVRGQIPFKEYCFPMPSCGGGENDMCFHVRKNDVRYADFCVEETKHKCEAHDEAHLMRAQFYFKHCGAWCCAHAGCQ